MKRPHSSLHPRNHFRGQTLARIPGAAGLEATSSANIGSELKGNVPPDVLRLLQQQGAERGVATGSPGSPNSNAAYLQALGLTSLDLMGRGEKDLTAAYARNPGAPLFDPTTQLMTPYQTGQLNAEQQRLQLEAQAEADRAAQAALHGGGGGGGRGGGGYSGGDFGAPMDFSSHPGDSGYTPTADWATDPQQAWWTSIGYGNQMPGGAAPMDWTSGLDNYDYSQTG